MKIQDKKHCTAIILAAGQGRRMGTSVQKQYIELQGRPLICYTLDCFERSRVIDDVVLVVGEGQEQYAQKQIVDRYGFAKVRTIVTGGKERYESVWHGLQAVPDDEGYIYIQDGARIFADEDILKRAYDMVEHYGACVAGMPSKDTVKMVDDNTFAINTPERKYVWIVQTPQVFDNSLIKEAYSRLMREECINVTDDAMVVEKMMNIPVKLFEGSYRNIKITTPEDLEIAKVFLDERKAEIKNQKNGN